MPLRVGVLVVALQMLAQRCERLYQIIPCPLVGLHNLRAKRGHVHEQRRTCPIQGNQRQCPLVVVGKPNEQVYVRRNAAEQRVSLAVGSTAGLAFGQCGKAGVDPALYAGCLSTFPHSGQYVRGGGEQVVGDGEGHRGEHVLTGGDHFGSCGSGMGPENSQLLDLFCSISRKS